MPKLSDDDIMNFLDSDGERHYFYNEEYYPDRLEELSREDIIKSCYILSIKIANKAYSIYNNWIAEKNNGEPDERKLRSLLEIFRTQCCDTRMLKIEDDRWYQEHHPKIEIDWDEEF